jgi:peptidoglycan-associated lipoprotein
MMTVRTISRLVGVLALSAATSAWMGCTSTPDEEKPGTDTGSEFREAPTPEGEGADQMGGKLAGFQTVYFDYDRAEVREDARPALRSNADKLNAGNLGTVTVEGHCDERGSTEYNLALGERRADAVRDYLVSLGLATDRLTIVSKGEEQPFCSEETEACWQQNRRGHFIITAK